MLYKQADGYAGLVLKNGRFGSYQLETVNTEMPKNVYRFLRKEKTINNCNTQYLPITEDEDKSC